MVDTFEAVPKGTDEREKRNLMRVKTEKADLDWKLSQKASSYTKSRTNSKAEKSGKSGKNEAEVDADPFAHEMLSFDEAFTQSKNRRE